MSLGELWSEVWGNHLRRSRDRECKIQVENQCFLQKNSQLKSSSTWSIQVQERQHGGQLEHFMKLKFIKPVNFCSKNNVLIVQCLLQWYTIHFNDNFNDPWNKLNVLSWLTPADFLPVLFSTEVYLNWIRLATIKNRQGLTTNKLFRTDGQDVATKQTRRMSTDSRDRLLQRTVSQPRPQPLHVTVTQQAACVQDTEDRKVMWEVCNEWLWN